MLLLKYPASAGADDRAEQRRFVGKFQQVTAPVMAKGLEDTAFYIYNRLLSLNEVGSDADRFGVAAGRTCTDLSQERQSKLAVGAVARYRRTTPSAARTSARA